MDDSEKRAILQAKRGPLENELYTAEVDLAIAKKHKDPVLAEEPEERLARIKDQLAVVEKKEAEIK